LIAHLLNYLSVFTVHTIQATGYIGIFFAMALESFMIPIPSEVILPFGGYLASSGDLNVFGVVLAGAIGGTVGSIALYYISALLGNAFIKRWGKYIFISEEHVKMTSEWFKKYGSFAIFTTRLLPVVRGIISIPAGIAKMNILSFTIYTFLGTFVWSLILTYFGFQLGLSNMSTHLVWIVTLVIAGIAVVMYMLSRLAKRHPTIFAISVNSSLVFVLIFFVSYSLYESYSPIKTTNLNYTNVEKICKEIKGNDFSFYVLGNTFQNLDAFKKVDITKNSSGNVFIISLGNMVYSGDRAKYRILLNEIKKISVPIVSIPGPLDLSDEGYPNYYNIFGNYDYTFNIHDVRFVMLNDANGKISPQQFNWLSNKISRTSTSSISIVAMSIPPSWAKSDSKVTLDKRTSDKLKRIFDSRKVLLLSLGNKTTISSSPIKYAIVDEGKYLHIKVTNQKLNIKIGKLEVRESNVLMEVISVYIYSLWVLEWPIIGIIGISILIVWLFFKHYKVLIKIEKRRY
jgi:membrane protein DedA with SNARE-associated domain